MRHLRQRFKAMQLAALSVLILACYSGCSLGDALIDGVFLGVSDTVGTLLSSALVG
ncbi:MAG: hypothetical protein IID37_06695 [Planctomycetes bacterium]|nr:hypothetical protein [Planctomycetota bacterium]